MDRITLTGIEATGFHGVFPRERRDGQLFVADVVLEMARIDTVSDRLEATVNYAQIAELVEAEIQGQPCDLIETLAGRIAERCLAQGPVEAVTVTVHKPQAPLRQRFADVAVTITRRRNDQRPIRD